MENSTQLSDNKTPDNDEKNLFDFSLKFNEKDYNCSLKEIGDRYLNIIVTFDSQKYENIYNLADFQKMNKNFRIYDVIDEFEKDLINYINTKRLKIINIQNNKLLLELTIMTKSNYIIILELNRTDNTNEKEKSDILNNNSKKDKNNYIIDELRIENREIRFLKIRKNNIQTDFEKEMNNNNENIKKLEPNLKSLEEKLDKIKEKELSIRNYLSGTNNNKSQRFIKMNNIMELKKKYKSIKMKKPVNEICIFPYSGNYIEPSGPKIYDKEHNLLMSLDTIGSCDHICLTSESSVFLAQKNKLILLKIVRFKENCYKYDIFKTELKLGTITNIIGESNNSIIVSDDTGYIYFFGLYGISLYIRHTINTYYKGNINLFLFKKHLIIAGDNLYVIKLEKIFDYKELNFKDGIANIKPSCWNSIVTIDENLNLIGVGCKSNIYILTIDEKEKNPIKYVIKIPNETSFIDALCLYQNNILIAGSRAGNLYFYSINNGNCQFFKKLENAHKYNKDSDIGINGIIELSDGAFATYGGDKKIKIWYI